MIKRYLEAHQKAIQDALLALMEARDTHARVAQAMWHSISAGGKRIRPILAIAATEATHGDVSAVMPIACAIEMIHTYSLIHDDLPAMDNDTLRRGKPTAHVQFDEATAILGGDALLTLAFEVMASPEDSAPEDLTKRLQVIQLIARAVGYQGMVQGQMLDIRAEGRHLDLDALIHMHRLKTGALIEASVMAGALFGHARQHQKQALRSYAKNIGLAFQVVDDILNVVGDPGTLGKAVGTDSSRGKNTFPALMGTHEATAYARDLVQNALNDLQDFDTKADPLRAIAQYIIERKH